MIIPNLIKTGVILVQPGLVSKHMLLDVYQI